MNIILLAGGEGKRLWSKLGKNNNKQFVDVFANDSDVKNMVQRVYKQIRDNLDYRNILFTTNISQINDLKKSIDENILISEEPHFKNTFPAIVLACSKFLEENIIDENETIIVSPVDIYVDDNFFKTFNVMEDLINQSDSNVVLCGIKPTNPSTEYGYILPEDKTSSTSKVSNFKEKPNADEAQQFLEKGALWNTGLFCTTPKFVMEQAHKKIDFKNTKDLILQYENLEKISFDKAVLDNEKSISVVTFEGNWVDIGSWENFSKALPDYIQNHGESQDD